MSKYVHKPGCSGRGFNIPNIKDMPILQNHLKNLEVDAKELLESFQKSYKKIRENELEEIISAVRKTCSEEVEEVSDVKMTYQEVLDILDNESILGLLTKKEIEALNIALNLVEKQIKKD